MCVEEEDEDEAKNQAPVLDSSSLVGKDDENWVLIKREQERWFKELKPWYWPLIMRDAARSFVRGGAPPQFV